ncbi:DUF3224 domain-containing protein [Luteibacter rhizovicinus]|nr:DUF3224 domain-containing protein [Luteibacter rhizovicinus]
MHATGTFEVKVAPQTADNAPAKASGLGRLSLDKQFHGELEGIGQGEMLAAGGGQSGAYVALEKVTGTLKGHKGSFILVHRSLMENGAPKEWTVVVVPDSGTEGLAGLSGSMKITITGGKHFYDLSYTLPEPK